LEDFHNDFRER